MEERQIPSKHQFYCVKNLVNAILSLQAILVLAFGACTNGKLKDENAPGSYSDSTALSEDFNGHLRIKDAHQYYTFRGDIPKEAYIEIVIDITNRKL